MPGYFVQRTFSSLIVFYSRVFLTDLQQTSRIITGISDGDLPHDNHWMGSFMCRDPIPLGLGRRMLYNQILEPQLPCWAIQHGYDGLTCISAFMDIYPVRYNITAFEFCYGDRMSFLGQRSPYSIRVQFVLDQFRSERILSISCGQRPGDQLLVIRVSSSMVVEC